MYGFRANWQRPCSPPDLSLSLFGQVLPEQISSFTARLSKFLASHLQQPKPISLEQQRQRREKAAASASRKPSKRVIGTHRERPVSDNAVERTRARTRKTSSSDDAVKRSPRK
jgi:hypothetical protein